MRIFDAHLHVIDTRFPLVPNDGYLPPSFTVHDYRARTRDLPIVGGAVVAGSFHGYDTAHLIDALERLGAGFVAVAQLPSDVSDDELRGLDRCGFRAIRINVRRSGRGTLEQLRSLAPRVADLVGWHTELYVDARDLPDLAPSVAALPAVSVDHLGLSAQGLPDLLSLVERGVRVKATGFGRVDLDVAAALRAIAEVDPTALLFGTDLPSTRAARPFDERDVAVVVETLGDDVARRVLHDNAAAFYRVTTG